MKHYTVEELQQRVKDRVQEWKDTIPGYREAVLERVIEQEMYKEAGRYNSDLDYIERCKEAEAQQKQEHSSVCQCVCTKIKALFK